MQGKASDQEHLERLRTKQAILARELEETNFLRIQAKERNLKTEEVNKNSLLRSIKVRRQQTTITSLTDNQGSQINNPDLMGKVMLDHLSQIIGKEDSPSLAVKEARAKVFEATVVSVELITWRGPFLWRIVGML